MTDYSPFNLTLKGYSSNKGLNIDIHRKTMAYTDGEPRYDYRLDNVLGTTYVGNEFNEDTTIYDIHYWSEDDCDEYFLNFIEDIKLFQVFIQDYFLSVEETLHFEIYKNESPLRLSDDIYYNYLNFNTNL